MSVVCMIGALAALLVLPGGACEAAPGAGASGCPLRFDQLTSGLPQACLFVGRYNQECGEEAVAMFAGDGTALVVGVSVSSSTPTLFLPAHVLSATEGKLVRWRHDLELQTAASAGHVTLEDGGGRLRITMPASLVQTRGCPFVEYVGQFVGMVSAGGVRE